MKFYWIYILKCSDNSYYTGITSNLENRVAEHNSGVHRGYTFSRLPVKLIFSQEFKSIKEAIEAEKRIKGWSRKKKEALINEDFELLHELSICKNKSHYKNK